MHYKKHLNKIPLFLLSAPFIYGLIVPIAFFDICLTIYKTVCFRLYETPLPKRSEYVRIDRHKLSYLNWFQKLNCIYCGYANGLVAYAVRIAGDTEKYWCGIQHEKEFEESAKRFYAQEHHKSFVKYGDEEGYREISKP